jgi:hypothetical protein
VNPCTVSIFGWHSIRWCKAATVSFLRRADQLTKHDPHRECTSLVYERIAAEIDERAARRWRGSAPRHTVVERRGRRDRRPRRGAGRLPVGASDDFFGYSVTVSGKKLRSSVRTSIMIEQRRPAPHISSFVPAEFGRSRRGSHRWTWGQRTSSLRSDGRNGRYQRWYGLCVRSFRNNLDPTDEADSDRCRCDRSVR